MLVIEVTKFPMVLSSHLITNSEVFEEGLLQLAKPKKALAQIYLVCQLYPFLNQEALLRIIHASVTSCYNLFFIELPLNSIEKLQVSLNAATWAGLRESRYTYLVSPLHRLLVSYWAQFKQLVITYKSYIAHIICGMACLRVFLHIPSNQQGG